ncbi:hypothetical protein PAXRUDRAFT_575346 [Paxillus rubicundulus Ve08.2h10]|uniref:Uncharacterized protein n=1 Tax=Paxillus rubicundulus Ve08.2h10 TaxID=930991 RepID=A0A0D0ECC8_9AGAM|nr:hypothetical protein PAXRUDRAFT_575346 [Paxillus rubicundulus Ve08.2h10]
MWVTVQSRPGNAWDVDSGSPVDPNERNTRPPRVKRSDSAGLSFQVKQTCRLKEEAGTPKEKRNGPSMKRRRGKSVWFKAKVSSGGLRRDHRGQISQASNISKTSGERVFRRSFSGERPIRGFICIDCSK